MPRTTTEVIASEVPGWLVLTFLGNGGEEGEEEEEVA